MKEELLKRQLELVKRQIDITKMQVKLIDRQMSVALLPTPKPSMKEELLKLWKEYKDFCSEQRKHLDKMNARSIEDYDKDYKKQVKGYPGTGRVIYQPPYIQSIYDTPSFEGFMSWLEKEG